MGFAKIIVAASSALLLCSAASAQDTVATDAKKEKKICKSEMKTGTRFKARTCKTAAEWEKIAEESRRALKDVVDRPQVETRRQ